MYGGEDVHMEASPHNPWWVDVLENGPSSVYADYFDIEWNPQKEALHNKVLLAALGAQYGDVLERGELKLVRQGGSFFVQYWGRMLPADPRPLWKLVERANARLGACDDDPRHHELSSIVTGLRNLPARTETERERQKERALTNGTPGDPRSFDAP